MLVSVNTILQNDFMGIESGKLGPIIVHARIHKLSFVRGDPTFTTLLLLLLFVYLFVCFVS